MTLKARIFAAASQDAGLQALLGTSPFRLYDTQLDEGALKASGGACAVVMIVSNPRDYTVLGRTAKSLVRVQIAVFGTGNDSENASAVVTAFENFFATFDAIDIPNLPAYPNLIVGDRDAGIAQTDPLTYQRIVDVLIFNKE